MSINIEVETWEVMLAISTYITLMENVGVLTEDITRETFETAREFTPVAKDRPLWGGGIRKGGTLRDSWNMEIINPRLGVVFNTAPYGAYVELGRTGGITIYPKKGKVLVFWKEEQWHFSKYATLSALKPANIIGRTLEKIVSKMEMFFNRWSELVYRHVLEI